MNVITVKRNVFNVKNSNNTIKIDVEAMSIVAEIASCSNRDIKDVASQLIKYAANDTVITDDSGTVIRGAIEQNDKN